MRVLSAILSGKKVFESDGKLLSKHSGGKITLRGQFYQRSEALDSCLIQTSSSEGGFPGGGLLGAPTTTAILCE